MKRIAAFIILTLSVFSVNAERNYSAIYKSSKIEGATGTPSEVFGETVKIDEYITVRLYYYVAYNQLMVIIDSDIKTSYDEATVEEVLIAIVNEWIKDPKHRYFKTKQISRKLTANKLVDQETNFRAHQLVVRYALLE